jgi:RHS repeat-associated protein
MTDSMGNNWTTHYDILGRADSTTDPDKGQTTSHYNDLGELEWTVDARGEKLVIQYDSLGRKIGLYDDAIAATNKLATWAYDPAGNKGQLASYSRWTGANRDIEYKTKIRGYTPLYQSTGEDYVIPTSETGLGGTYTFTKSYKVDGSPATVGYPNAGGLGGETLTYTYDAVTGKAEQLQTNWPGAGQYVTNTDFTAYGEMAFVEFGQTASSWVQRAFTYDEVTRAPVQFTTIRQTAPQIIADLHYTYDAANNITKIADTPAGGTADTQCFDYDYLRRLEAAWTPSNGDCAPAPTLAGLGGPAPYWNSWVLDKAGNRSSQSIHLSGTSTDSTFGHVAAGSARPHAVTNVVTTGPGAGTKNYAYDNSGNQTCRPQPGVVSNTCPSGAGSQELRWNSEGQLYQHVSGSSTYDYLYDAEGNRLVARDSTGTTLYLPGNELRRKASDGTVSATRYYNHNGNTCAMRTTTGLTWLASDHQGTQSIAIAAGNQTITQRRQTPYGTSRGTAVTWPNPKGFVGGDADATGLSHLGAREYDTTLGGFISVDPIIDPNDPQQLNAYAYSNNSPITMSDASGKRFMADDYGGPSAPASTTAAPPAKKETGCSAVKLNCTIDDINAMTVVQRKEMVKVWLNVYASKYNAQDSFENIMGVLDFMIDDDIAKPGSWSSWVDSTILHGVQNGLAISEGVPVASSNPGGEKWATYFAFTKENPGVDDSERRRKWSEAEQASTEYGYGYSASKGVPIGTAQELAFAGAAEVYRLALRHQDTVDGIAFGVGWALCPAFLAARCAAKAVKTERDLLNPSNHDPCYLGGHVISGTVLTVEGYVTGDPIEMAKGVAEVATYGPKVVKEAVDWLFDW